MSCTTKGNKSISIHIVHVPTHVLFIKGITHYMYMCIIIKLKVHVLYFLRTMRTTCSKI